MIPSKRLMIAALFVLILLITGNASSQSHFYPSSVIGSYQFYPFVSVNEAGIALVGYTNELRPDGRYSVVRQKSNGWLTISNESEGWNPESSSATSITHALTGEIVVPGNGVVMAYNSSEHLWTRFETNTDNIERRFTSATATTDGVLLPCSTSEVISRDTVNGIVRTVVKMYFEVFILTNDSLNLIGRSLPGERRVELSNFVNSEDDSYAAFYHSDASDSMDVVRIRDGKMDFIDIGIPTPPGITPRACQFTDGSIGFVYGRGLNGYGAAIRWNPASGVVYAKSPDNIPGNVTGLIAMDNVFVAISGHGTLWTFDGTYARDIPVTDLVAADGRIANTTRDIKVFGDNLYVTTDIGLFVIGKSLLTTSSVSEAHGISQGAYPNPVTGSQVIVPLPEGSSDNITVHSMHGQAVVVSIINDGKRLTISTDGVPSGTYYVVIVDGGRKSVRPFTVLR